MSNMSNIAVRDGDVVAPVDGGREFWRGVLMAGGSTVLPRRALNPVTGVHEHEATIPDELVAALRRLANELAVPLSSVLLTAHAKVLGALSGEREVCTGYAVEGRSPLLCRMTTEPHSWRAMLLETNRAESELLSHKDFPVYGLRRELGLINPLFQTVFPLTAGHRADRAQACKTAGPRNCSRSEFGHPPTPSRPRTVLPSGLTESSMLAPIRWHELCWRGGFATKASWAW